MMKILVADDDPVTLEAVDACLQAEGFRTVLCGNGEAAWEKFEEAKPDLVCLDIMMPGMDGFEVCRRIRRVNEEVPVLFLSAKNDEVDVVVGLELGADDFVRKPFGRRELVARVRAALRRKGAGGREVTRFEMGKLEVFPKKLRAERGGEEIELTPREVGILELLFERKGEAVSRDDLLDRCWGTEYYPESRTLDQHVAKLRKKVERRGEAPELIETVRGVGYRWRGV